MQKNIFLIPFLVSLNLSLITPSLWAQLPAFAEAGAVRVVGTKVYLVPPQDFSKADKFTGYWQKSSDASIVVTEIPGPYDQVVTGFTKSELAAKGMNLTATSAAKSGNKAATLIEFTQSAYGKKFKKTALIFGDQVTTMLVTGTMPDDGPESLFDKLRASVKSAHYDPHLRVSTIDEGLPFTLADSKKFKKATRIQNTLLYTTTGRVKAGQDNGPLFVAGQSVGDVAVADRSTFARERLDKTPHLKNVTVLKEQPLKQAGLDGFEFLAEAVDSTDNVPTYVYHAMLFDKSGYFIFQGLCPVSARAEYEPEYQKLVKNFQLR